MTGFGYNINGFGAFPDRDSGVRASGGTKTISGIYTIHTFTSSGTFAVGDVGTYGSDAIEFLIIAGGAAIVLQLAVKILVADHLLKAG